jgi:short-chain Z-isoprenyl diphosphate synthase
VFSTDNLGRGQAEIGGILAALEAKMLELAADPHIAKRGVRVAAIGRREILPGPLLAAIDAAELATRDNDRMMVTLAVGYGGREEIADAVRSLLTDCAEQGLSAAEAAAQVSPEAMRRIDYLRAIRSFQRRERRYGI